MTDKEFADYMDALREQWLQFGRPTLIEAIEEQGGSPFGEALLRRMDERYKANNGPVVEDERAEPVFTEAQLKNQRNMAFRKTRIAVYDRDEGVCQVCKDKVAFEGEYECGHKIDRQVGGSDEPENLVVMCYLCNRTKPITETMEEYEAWAAMGGKLKVLEDAVRQFLLLYPDAFKYTKGCLDTASFYPEWHPEYKPN